MMSYGLRKSEVPTSMWKYEIWPHRVTRMIFGIHFEFALLAWWADVYTLFAHRCEYFMKRSWRWWEEGVKIKSPSFEFPPCRRWFIINQTTCIISQNRGILPPFEYCELRCTSFPLELEVPQLAPAIENERGAFATSIQREGQKGSREGERGRGGCNMWLRELCKSCLKDQIYLRNWYFYMTLKKMR